MLKLKLEQIMAEKRIKSTRELSEMTGIRWNTVSDMVKNTAKHWVPENLEKLMIALELDDVSELIEWDKEQDAAGSKNMGETNVPFGYKMQDGKIVQDEYQASIIRLMAELYLQHEWGGVNLKRIFRDLDIPLDGEGELSEEQKRLIRDEFIKRIPEQKEPRE